MQEHARHRPERSSRRGFQAAVSAIKGRLNPQPTTSCGTQHGRQNRRRCPRLPRPRRGRRSGPRPRPLCRRRARAEPGLRLFRALAACLCPYRERRYFRRNRRARRHCRIDRARHGGHRQYFAAPAAAGQEWLKAHRHQPAGARQRPRHAYRRGGGHGRRRARDGGAGRRRIRPCRVRAAHAGDRRARRAQTGRAANLAGSAQQPRGRLAGAGRRPECQCRRGRAPVRFG